MSFYFPRARLKPSPLGEQISSMIMVALSNLGDVKDEISLW